MINANPRTSVSSADFLFGYGPWVEPSRCGERQDLPGHNSSYKRKILLGYGPRLEEMLEAEMVMQWDMRSRGLRFFQPESVRTHHTNISLFSPYAETCFYVGRQFGAARARHWNFTRRAIFFLASPLIPAVRFAKLLREAKTSPVCRREIVHGLMPLLAGLLLDGLGQMIGYGFGGGDSGTKLKHVEFNRAVNVTAEDRRLLFEFTEDRTPVETVVEIS
jgi:hypothetical protein